MKSTELYTMTNLILYSTSDCHLCDQARALIAAVDPHLVFEEMDICHDDRMILRYGERIPVLRRHDTSEELGWPFDVEQVKRFVS